METITKPVISIAGRRFTGISESTLLHDSWTHDRLKECGLSELHMVEGESPDSFANRIVSALLREGRIFPLLGAMMIPADRRSTDWTPAMAEETAEFFKQITDPAEKTILRNNIGALVQGFLKAELTLLKLIPRYSDLAAQA